MPSTRAADLKSGVILFRQRKFIKPTIMKIQTIVLVVAGIVCLASAGLPAQQQASGNLVSCGAPSCPYLNPALTPEARAKDLVSRMTLEEKASQMQDVAPAIPRLGIPAYNWWNEALHGVARNGFATNFPQSIGLAATWDTALMRRIASVIAVEGRAKYNEAIRNGDHSRFAGLTFWSPNINIDRDPRWGRGMETFGEDPFLTASMGVEFVEGLQGDNPKYLELVSTPKHYAVHSGPEPLRHGFNVDVSDHDLEDTYLPAFRATIVEGHADSIMCAYNAIDGAPACANTMLLQQHLRDNWGFRGYTVSDCDAVGDIDRGHHFAANAEEASAAAVKAGTDLDCGRTYAALTKAVGEHLLTEADIDAALVRLFTARMRLGMFDPPAAVPFNAIPYSEVNSAAHRELALQAARESIVLLENRNGTLPLKPSIRRIAVIGPTADLLESIEGNYNGTAPQPVSPLNGLRKEFGAANVIYAPGSVLAAGSPAPIPSAYLRTDESLKTEGLKGEYFDNEEFKGAPRLVRVDTKINFDWNRVTPVADFPGKSFAVRWTGELLPPAAGKYVLSVRGPRPVNALAMTGETGGTQGRAEKMPDRVRLYVDGKLVLTMDSHGGPAEARLSFADTKPHSIRVEYVHLPDDRIVDLNWEPPANSLLGPAIDAAAKSDAIVAFVGLSPNLEGEEMNVHVDGFDGGDRTQIELPEQQEHLLDALGATGKPLIVVLTSGGALAVPWAREHADALLEAWYPGEEGGDAIAETLTGKNNPAGRLPVTFYAATGDLPAFTDYSMKNRTYRYFRGRVLYPFGYGLSYSQFSFGPAHLSGSSIQAGAHVTLTVEVSNTSKRDGDEVAELYITPTQTSVTPHLELEGFKRIHLRAGETRQVRFTLDARQLSEVDEKGNRAVVPGDYSIFVGGGQPAAGAPPATLHIAGTMALPR
ncbi:MAG: glycoside hydrolase family 3 C-terminal domain-containing protein [Terracidiphilus sp.]|jgi:beta-glucosidase